MYVIYRKNNAGMFNVVQGARLITMSDAISYLNLLNGDNSDWSLTVINENSVEFYSLLNSDIYRIIWEPTES